MGVEPKTPQVVRHDGHRVLERDRRVDPRARARERDDVGAVLIGARGDSFTAGNDLRDFLDQPPHGDDAPVIRFLIGLATTDVPVVAAVRGNAVGVGTTLLLHCDLVYASPTAKFKVPFVDLGLVPEAGSSVLLPRRIGRAHAGGALYLGEPISAE